MSANRRRLASAFAPRVEVVTAHCDLCGERGTCASYNAGAATVCFLCLVSSAQIIASAQSANKRPHGRPCTCEACVHFDEGQRGEIANLVMLERPLERASVAPSEQVAEVQRPERPHLEPCTCDECRRWTREVNPSRFTLMEVDQT